MCFLGIAKSYIFIFVGAGEGMPISKSDSKGDLVIRFHILFPKYLNGVKRTKLRELLANEPLQT